MREESTQRQRVGHVGVGHVGVGHVGVFGIPQRSRWAPLV